MFAGFTEKQELSKSSNTHYQMQMVRDTRGAEIKIKAQGLFVSYSFILVHFDLFGCVLLFGAFEPIVNEITEVESEAATRGVL